MKERVVIGNAELWHGDIVDMREQRELWSHDALITDPPYGMNYKSGYATDALWKAGDAIYGDLDTFARNFAISQFRWRMALVFGTWKVERPAGTRMVLVWDKGGALGMGDLSLPWKPDHEEIYVLGTGFVGARDCGSVVQHPPVQSMAKNGRVHPTEKPLGLMLKLLRKTAGTVLDPFMGSGTTGVACIQMGRQFTGIERERKYFDIACERILRAQAQGQMFEPEPPKAEQGALL